MSPTTPVVPVGGPKPKRQTLQRTERVIAESVTTTVDDPRFTDMETRLTGQFTNEVRNLEKHLSEWQGTQVAAYEQVTGTVGTLATAVKDLTTQVGQLVKDRTDDAAFISAKRTEEANKAHQAELDAVAAQTRAAIVLEQQAAKEQADKEAEVEAAKFTAKRKVREGKRNRVLTMALTTTGSLIVVLIGYLVTGTGYQTSTSRATVVGLIVFLFLFAIGLAVLINPPESAP